MTPPASLASRRVGFVLKSFNGFGLTAAGQSIVGVNLKLFSIGLDVLRTLDLNYFSRIWLVFGRVGFAFLG